MSQNYTDASNAYRKFFYGITKGQVSVLDKEVTTERPNKIYLWFLSLVIKSLSELNKHLIWKARPRLAWEGIITDKHVNHMSEYNSL